MAIAEIDRAELRAKLIAIAPQVLPFADQVWLRLDEARRALSVQRQTAMVGQLA